MLKLHWSGVTPQCTGPIHLQWGVWVLVGVVIAGVGLITLHKKFFPYSDIPVERVGTAHYYSVLFDPPLPRLITSEIQ